MISTRLLLKMYEAASIQRWNDHARPFEIVELDKQAHKMVIAYVIAQLEESDRNTVIDWIGLIEGGIFEFFHRTVLTDIKPAVFSRMMEEKGPELNQYVVRRLKTDFGEINDEFLRRFETYLLDPTYQRFEKRILRAAHYIASDWEFGFIYSLNSHIYGIEKTRQEMLNRLEDFYDLIGVQKISLKKRSYGFIDLCGQLRFQKRWSGSPRIPQTSVLGHMLIVAVLSYLSSIEMGACAKRKHNNFFAGLYHDLPEVLTRDIINPVKHSIEGLDEIIKDYEKMQIQETLLPLIPRSWYRELRYFNDYEFENKVLVDGKVVMGISGDEMMKKYNEDRFSPVDGEIIRACDELAAFIEAALSIRYGIKSPYLLEAVTQFKKRYENTEIPGLVFSRIIEDITAA